MFCELALLPAIQYKPFHGPAWPCSLWIQSPVSAKTKSRKSVAGTLQKHSLHTCPTKALQSAHACQHLHKAANALCQGLTFEQRATVSDVSVLLSVLNSLSLFLTKAAGIVFCCCEIFGMNVVDALPSQWSNPVNIFFVFHCCPLLQAFDTSL